MSENKAVIAWEATGKKGYALVAERILDLKNKGNTLCGEIERLEESLKQTAEVLHEANNLAEAAIKDKKRLEAENKKLREAASLALDVISRSGDSTSSCAACMLTLKSALEA